MSSTASVVKAILNLVEAKVDFELLQRRPQHNSPCKDALEDAKDEVANAENALIDELHEWKRGASEE